MEQRDTKAQKSPKSQRYSTLPRWNTIPTQSHRPPSKKKRKGRQEFNHLGQRTDGRTDRRDAVQRRLLARRSRATLPATVGRRRPGRLLPILMRMLLLPTALFGLPGHDPASRTAAVSASTGS